MEPNELRLFALGPSRPFGERLARRLGVPLAEHEERDFEDGEHKSRPLVSVRGKDVFAVHSLYGEPGRSVNDKLCRLLFFLGALRDASAGRVTAVIPYLGYARKDRKTQPRDPVTTRYVAALLEAVGTDRVVTLDVHNLAAFQNAFRCATDHLEATPLLLEHFVPLVGDREAVVVSPDVGGVKRADRFRDALGRVLERPLPGAFLEKQRARGVVRGGTVVGEVRGRVALVIDDLVSTGTTLSRAAHALRDAGASEVHAAASHGLFVGSADQALADPALDSLAVTDTIPAFRLRSDTARGKLTLLDAASLFARAVERIHVGGSLVELLGL